MREQKYYLIFDEFERDIILRSLNELRNRLLSEGRYTGTYVRQGDYLIPCLTLPTEKETKPIGVWGQQRLWYLKEYHGITYANLLTSGRLNAYLADIDRQAQERFKTLTEQMKQAQGITEQLKAKNALEWAGRMNNIRACVREIVNEEIIYS